MWTLDAHEHFKYICTQIIYSHNLVAITTIAHAFGLKVKGNLLNMFFSLTEAYMFCHILRTSSSSFNSMPLGSCHWRGTVSHLILSRGCRSYHYCWSQTCYLLRGSSPHPGRYTTAWRPHLLPFVTSLSDAPSGTHSWKFSSADLTIVRHLAFDV